MSVPIIIDGPNFINRLLDEGIDHDLIAAQLSLVGLREVVTALIAKEQVKCEDVVEFVCSQNLFGPKENRFTPDEQRDMLDRLARERGVHIEKVTLPGSKEKGVDGTVQLLLDAAVEHSPTIVLVAADRDYVPILKKLRQRRKKVILVSFQEQFPAELANEAWSVVDGRNDLVGIFNYSYPKYKVTMPPESFRKLIANADDRDHNCLMVSHHGNVTMQKGIEYLGRDKTQDKRLDAKFYFEIFVAGNGYTGPKAASDKSHVDFYYRQVNEAWSKNMTGFIDVPIW